MNEQGKVDLTGDELIAVGPWDGQSQLAADCGHSVRTDDTSVVEIVEPG